MIEYRFKPLTKKIKQKINKQLYIKQLHRKKQEQQNNSTYLYVEQLRFIRIRMYDTCTH